jgi:DNA (cytosine-5)-methyltransferase 1
MNISYHKNTLKTKKTVSNNLHTFVDMFCGIGSFHLAAATKGLKCVYACDIDKEARRTYEHNFGINPSGDISHIMAKDVPDHDLFCAGFPCQPFSIIGKQHGFEDIRGTLFFDIIRILKAKQPRAVLLENVKQLMSHNKGHTINRITESLRDLGYYVDIKVLNALDFGLPQKRERVIIVATRDKFNKFPWPINYKPMKPLKEILEVNPDQKYFVSDYIRHRRKKAHISIHKPGIWHENKAGNISSHPFSCALRAGASYNYLLVDGKRRLTPREMLRLQGFPDSFEIVCSDSQARKQAGNSVPVPLVSIGLEGILNVIGTPAVTRKHKNTQKSLSSRRNTRLYYN